MLNVNKFVQSVTKKGGLAGTSKYVVRINPKSLVPTHITKRFFPDDLELYCSSVNLPGKSFVNIDYRQYTYDTIQRRPINVTFNDLTCTFLIDMRGDTLAFFNTWMNYIIGTSDFIGDSVSRNVESYVHEVSYPEEYLTDIDIYVLNPNVASSDQVDIGSEAVAHYKVYDAFPIIIGDVDLGYGNQNTVAAFTVVFAYKNFRDMFIASSYAYKGVSYAPPVDPALNRRLGTGGQGMISNAPVSQDARDNRPAPTVTTEVEIYEESISYTIGGGGGVEVGSTTPDIIEDIEDF